MHKAALITAALTTAAAGLTTAAPGLAAAAAPDSFTQTNLVANAARYHARLTDQNLTNAWGLAAGPGQPLWVADNDSGKVTVYSGGVGGGAVTLGLTVTVPGGNGTGQVYNPDQKAFPVGGPKGSPARFIVDTDQIGPKVSPGEIAAWHSGGKFVVEDSPAGGPGGKTPKGGIFEGLAIATTPKAGPELFAADVADGRVDVFSSRFRLLSTPGEFRDPAIPAGYAPFGIQELGGKIYVTYGKQNRQKNNVVYGAGFGYVDVFSVNGRLVHHLVARGPLDAPWGLAIAPKGFGPFGGDLLVGNLGKGEINAFSPVTGRHLGTLDAPDGKPVAISGLWALQAGSPAFGGSSAVVFSAGPIGYENGLLGTLTPAG
jgi:uncharacterized protein (TIGR03118 family)